ncbi:MAG: Sb-PDE family phosphodiesterase [Bacteroidales bacterium]
MSKTKLLFVSLLVLGVTVVKAQTDNGVVRMDEFRNPTKREIINIPDVNGYQTLKCDFHTHTVFSDGHVWPNVRVQEAWKEGLDVLAITDHIEYTPHSEDVAVDHNRSYELAEDMASERNIVFIKGTEITRNTPPGHFNALYIGDASGYIEDNDSDKDKNAVLKAANQDAFIFWNHPGWKVNQVEGSYEWIDFIDELYNEDRVHGIEVFNGFSFYKNALDWCVDKDLTVMGTSDIHNLVEHDYDLDNELIRRTMTLVFAEEKTPASVREALEEGRTVAWASKYLAGKEEHVRDLFHACVETGAYYPSGDGGNGEGSNYYEIRNKSDLYFEMELKSGDATQKITLQPGSSQIITANGDQESLTYEVVNAYVRSDKHLVVDIGLN